MPSLNKFPQNERNDVMWSKIPGILENYEVNPQGDFRNIDTNEFLLGEKMNKGYIRMHLKNLQGEVVRVMAHILVAETFIGPKPSDEYQINHKDSNTSNNRVENLEWVTPQENVDHKMKNMSAEDYKAQQKLMSAVGKKYGAENGRRSAKPVASIDIETNEIVKEYPSARAAAEDGFNYKNISAVCNGHRRTHKGYKWKFI